MGVKLVGVHLDGHDHLFERRVARALTEAVDGALDLRGACAHAGDGKRRGHAKVVMGVHGDGHLVNALDLSDDLAHERSVLIGQAEARGLGKADDGRAGVDGGLHGTHHEIGVGAASVLGEELHVVDLRLCAGDTVGDALEALVLAHVQLLLEVDGRDADTQVDARALGHLEGLGRAVDVLVTRARECADHAAVACQRTDLLHGTEVAGARYGEASLDDVDPKT